MKKGIDQDAIIKAALTLLDKEGLKAVTLKNVSVLLGIKPPSLYNHVESLNELLELTAKNCLAKLSQNLLESVVGLQSKEALLALSNEYRKFFKCYPNQYRLIQQVGVWSQHAGASAESTKMIALLSKVLAKSGLSQKEMIHFIRAWRSYMHGFLLLETNDSFKMKEDINASFAYGLAIFAAKLKE
ncbi:TetR/AcrR family transcriptional regulator [Liquorilactobacillus satsumensis]|uniref:HTH tetR-type domain-containing protein n=1 Tax=Liquorilactobacillus satsumensis DSM 16230 = JCM 12392 TaxID=1423801 RepID=A0A0R1V705_9LACO|nr:TetR/AcrR family transcriptional regulator [Liquorilactobacillus satsumensis]KRL98866.1 hypothetical protein FD50_GL000679 [Liquorilactobacillus satsumensis DSM 16230 = JCM 12392]MCC7666290.1 TetR/AcrR family transcriptional regulator [Liquorilactobacillus satsumensis]MCP9327951.1 WHG domain-containing protein [Liquorilactobacillus satsumensis]MCP9358395.1 WHG domain-containing protein [Liquorilactobacillus satsumensis]MCP9372349.1 WHG domain-containing protein [Liquorilactobacillus satsume